MTSSQILQEQVNKVLQQTTQTLKTVNIEESEENDPHLKRVKEIILLHCTDKGKEHPTVKRLPRERQKLKINNSNILIRQTTDAEQIIIPPSLKWVIFHQNMAHLGPERTCKSAKKRVYWPNMENDIQLFIDHKCPCLASEKTDVITQAPLETITENTSMDIE